MSNKSLEFGSDLKESSKFKVDSMSTNYKFVSLDVWPHI